MIDVFGRQGLDEATDRKIRAQLARRPLGRTLGTLSGLLTIPDRAPHALRLDLLVHLAAACCRGWWPITDRQLHRWLHHDLETTRVASLEDPPEDVFTSCVLTPDGTSIIFEGVWEQNAANLQVLLDCVAYDPTAPLTPSERDGIDALLRLSDEVASRAGVGRWSRPGLDPPLSRLSASGQRISDIRQRCVFSIGDLENLQIHRGALEPFVLGDPASAARPRIGHSALERRPLIAQGDGVLLALPTAVSPAIRRFLLEWARDRGVLSVLEKRVWGRQSSHLFSHILPRIAPEHEGAFEIHRTATEVGAVDVARFALDRGHELEVSLWLSRLTEPLERGLDGITEMDDQSLRRVLTHGAAQRGGDGKVHSLMVLAGIGRGLAMGMPEVPSRTTITAVSLHDLDVLVSAEGFNAHRLVKLAQAEADALDSGMVVSNLNGFLNLYAFWEELDYSLIPDEMPYPREHSLVAVAPSFLRDIRVREKRKVDRHALPFHGSPRSVPVERIHVNSFFPGHAERAIYAAPSFLSKGRLVGVVEGLHGTVWVTAQRPEEGPEVRDILYRIWDAVLQWLDRANETGLTWRPPHEDSSSIALVLVGPSDWLGYLRNAQDLVPEEPTSEVDPDTRTVIVRLPVGFVSLLNRPTNDGERALMLQVFRGLAALPGSGDTTISPSDLTTLVLGGDDRRELHMFRSRTPTDALDQRDPMTPRLVQDEDRSAALVGLAWKAIDQSDEGTVLATERETLAFLHKIVDALWGSVKPHLSALDRESVVTLAMRNLQGLYSERDQWRRTARAVLAIHGNDATTVEIAARRESQRAIASLSSRVLVEMAAVTCPAKGGREASWFDFDALLAQIAALIEMASSADAIKGGVTPAEVHISPSGRVAVDHTFFQETAHPYAHSLFATGFQEAASDYDSFFRQSERAEGASEPEKDAAFLNAFEAEYRISYDDFIGVLGELLDIAIETRKPVVVVSRRRLTTRLRHNRGLSKGTATTALDTLCLPLRDKWDEQNPVGYRREDWYPWRFRRRLSLTVCPVVQIGPRPKDRLLVSVRQLAASVSYLVSGIRDAFFPTEFFHSPEMRAYVGHRSNELGHAFASSVRDSLEGEGWQAMLEVEMASLGAPAELGDVDVLAWREDDDALLVVECKRLIPRRNIYEIVEELESFRGEAKDRLGRHVSRVGWIEKNLASVHQRVGVPTTVTAVLPLIVTNRVVPMRYRIGLPIPAERFIQVDELVSLSTNTTASNTQ